MDRMIVYPGAIPLDTDLLNIQRGAMKAVGFLAQMCLGGGPVIDGLACQPTVPSSMQITVGPGSILVSSEVDTQNFGTLPADTSNLVKMGINTSSSLFTLTAPTVSGQSINYLIEASFLEQDAVPVVLPYYNAANPAQGLAGAGNDGAAQNTQRLQTVALQLKAGAAANTGVQSTPAVDSGWVPVAVITVNAGQSTVETRNITVPGSAPLVPLKLPQMNFGAGTGREGWQMLPSGVVVQWGSGTTVTGNLDPVSFPLTFPGTALAVTVCEAACAGWTVPGTPYPVPTIYGVNALSASGFQVSCISPLIDGASSSIVFSKATGFNWMAVGV